MKKKWLNMWSDMGNSRTLTNLHICIIYFPFFESGAILKFYCLIFEINLTEKEMRIYFALHTFPNKHFTKQKC